MFRRALNAQTTSVRAMASLHERFVSPPGNARLIATVESKSRSFSFAAANKNHLPFAVQLLRNPFEKWLKCQNIPIYKRCTHVNDYMRRYSLFHVASLSHHARRIVENQSESRVEISGRIKETSYCGPAWERHNSFPKAEGHKAWWHLPDNIEEEMANVRNYSERLEEMQKKLGVRLRSKELLLRALVHESYYNIAMPSKCQSSVVMRPKSFFVVSVPAGTAEFKEGVHNEQGDLEGQWLSDLNGQQPLDSEGQEPWNSEEQQPLDSEGRRALDSDDMEAIPCFTAHKILRSQLEFLGDAIISFTTTDYLVQHHPLVFTGVLTPRKCTLVSNKIFAKVGVRHLGLLDVVLTEPHFILLTQSAQVTAVSNSVEMLVGALYIEQGFVGASGFVASHLIPLLEKEMRSSDISEDLARHHMACKKRVEEDRLLKEKQMLSLSFSLSEESSDLNPDINPDINPWMKELFKMEEERVEWLANLLQVKNPVSVLQELIQKILHREPEYRVVGEGTFGQQFKMGVFVNGVQLSTGFGNSKSEAKRNTATSALLKFGAKFPPSPSS